MIKILKNKRGAGATDDFMKALFLIFAILFIVVSLGSLITFFLSAFFGMNNFHEYTAIDNLLNSKNGIGYYNQESDRYYPNIIDESKLNGDELSKILSGKSVSMKIELVGPKPNTVVKTLYFKEDTYKKQIERKSGKLIKGSFLKMCSYKKKGLIQNNMMLKISYVIESE